MKTSLIRVGPRVLIAVCLIGGLAAVGVASRHSEAMNGQAVQELSQPNAFPPYIAIDPTFLQIFSHVGEVGQSRVHVSNPGWIPLTMGDAVIAEQDADNFAISHDGCAQMVLQHSESCDIWVTFLPIVEGGPVSGTLVVQSDANIPQYSVWLRGYGYLNADMSVRARVTPVYAKSGQVARFKLVVENLGPDLASSVWVRQQLPRGFEFVDAKASQGTCSFYRGYEPDYPSGVFCSLAAIAPGGRAMVEVTLKVTASRGITLMTPITVNGFARDIWVANNSTTVSLTVRGGPPTPAATPTPKPTPTSTPIGCIDFSSSTVCTPGPTSTGPTPTPCIDFGGTATCAPF